MSPPRVAVKVGTKSSSAPSKAKARKPRRSGPSRTEGRHDERSREPDREATPPKVGHRLDSIRESAAERSAAPRLEEKLRPDEIPRPDFELPALPETELADADQTAREAELADAARAVHRARNAGGTVDAFAEAPPSVKARMQGSLDNRIDKKVQDDQQSFEEGLPDFHAEMGGTPLGEHEQVPPIRVREPEEVALEGPLDLFPQPEALLWDAPPPFTANEQVETWLEESYDEAAPEEDRAQAIESSLDLVEIRDPNLETSPGPPPKVVLEGETDLGRVSRLASASQEEGYWGWRQATDDVAYGPGPEAVQLHAMDEAYCVEELDPVEVDPKAATPGAREFTALELPDEIVAQFDADQQGVMRENLSEARDEVHGAESERNRDRQQAVEGAEAERQQAVEGADLQQRGEVLDGRREIQIERQAALDGQALEVHEFSKDADRKAVEKSRDLKQHIRKQEGAIADAYHRAEAEVVEKTRKTEEEARAAREATKKKSRKRSWWQRAKSWVKNKWKAFKKKIQNLVNRLVNWIKEKFNQLRAWAKRKIDQLASWVKGAIDVFRDALKVSVNVLLGERFPALARRLNEKIDRVADRAKAKVDEVAEALKKKVDEIVDRLEKALNTVVALFLAALGVGLKMLWAILTGDWKEVLRLTLVSVLKVLGIDPDSFFAYFEKAFEVIGNIIKAPGKFLGNCVDAVLQGVQSFASNFLEHLKNGIIEWLTGTLGGVDIPEKFDLVGVLDLGTQLLGLGWDWLEERAVKLVGEENAEKLQEVRDFVDEIREEGWGALLGRLEEHVTGLKDRILDQIQSYLVERVILEAVKWIGALFVPGGGLVKLVFTIWNLFEFLREKLARILGVLSTVVDAVSDIAQGILDAAVARVEDVLSGLLATAISLLAHLLNLGGVGRKVREVFGAVRERIDGAADKYLGRAFRRFAPGKGRKRKAERDGAQREEREGAAQKPAERTAEATPAPKAPASRATSKPETPKAETSKPETSKPGAPKAADAKASVPEPGPAGVRRKAVRGKTVPGSTAAVESRRPDRRKDRSRRKDDSTTATDKKRGKGLDKKPAKGAKATEAEVRKAKAREGQEPEHVPGRQGATKSLGRDMRISREGMSAARLFIVAENGDATVMIKASPARPLKRYLAAAKTKADAGPVLSKKYGPVIAAAYAKLSELDDVVDQVAREEWRLLHGNRTARARRRLPKLRKRIAPLQSELYELVAEIVRSPGLRTETSDNPILNIFAKDLERAHPNARRNLEETLKVHAEADWQTLPWSRVQAKLVNAHLHATKPGLLANPLRGEFKYTEELRATLERELKRRQGQSVEIGGETYTYPDAAVVDNLITHHIAKTMQMRVLLALRQDVFSGKSHGDVVATTLQPAILEGVKSQKDDSKIDLEFKAAINSADSVLDFLKQIALGKKVNGTVDRAQFAVYMSQTKNREYFGDRYRSFVNKQLAKPQATGENQHEWVPTNKVQSVVDRAMRDIASGEAPLVSLIWLEMQDAFRAPTKGLLFNPTKKNLRRQIRGRPPAVEGQELIVFQGHVGASYAPVKDNYAYAEKPQQQTEGSPDWHAGLDTLYASSPGDLIPALRNIWTGVRRYYKDTIWDGSKSAELTGFDEYYASDKKTFLGFAGLERQFTTAKVGVDRGFRSAADVVSQAKYMKFDPQAKAKKRNTY